jgi:hypothetical protein
MLIDNMIENCLSCSCKKINLEFMDFCYGMDIEYVVSDTTLDKKYLQSNLPCYLLLNIWRMLIKR